MNSQSVISHFFNAVVLRKSVRGSITYIATATSWINRELFNNLGKFDEAFRDAAGEDAEFCIRVHRNNINVEESNIRAYHENPATFQDLIGRAKRYATRGWLYHVRLREHYGYGSEKSKISFFERLSSLMWILLRRIFTVFKTILNQITFDVGGKLRRYFLRLIDGLNKAQFQHDHHFIKFTKKRKLLFIFYAIVWSFTYRYHLRKQDHAR
jgi:hypothetical protein